MSDGPVGARNDSGDVSPNAWSEPRSLLLRNQLRRGPVLNVLLPEGRDTLPFASGLRRHQALEVWVFVD